MFTITIRDGHTAPPPPPPPPSPPPHPHHRHHRRHRHHRHRTATTAATAATATTATTARYVELLVDGAAVARATGACTELMRNVTWDVTDYIGRAAQLRIVDASSSVWGHTNVDHVVFSWYRRGGAIASSVGRTHFTSVEATARAGAAYAFRRKDNASDESCAHSDSGNDDPEYCDWEEQAKLMASDKRAGDLFGCVRGSSVRRRATTRPARALRACGAPARFLTWKRALCRDDVAHTRGVQRLCARAAPTLLAV